MRRNISNVHCCVIGAPLFGSTLAPRRSIAFRNSAGTWSRAPGKQFGVLGRWRDRHTRPARWSDALRIRPVRWRKWNRIRIDLARLADPIASHNIHLNTQDLHISHLAHTHNFLHLQYQHYFYTRSTKNIFTYHILKLVILVWVKMLFSREVPYLNVLTTF